MPHVTIQKFKPLPQLGELTVNLKNIDAHDLSKRNGVGDKYCSTRRQQE